VTTYIVIVRNEEGTSFDKVYVVAESESEAVEKVRARGLVVDQVLGPTARPRPAAGAPGTAASTAPSVHPRLEPATSCDCGFSLDGLVVREGIVTCPECGRRHVVARWRSE